MSIKIYVGIFDGIGVHLHKGGTMTDLPNLIRKMIDVAGGQKELAKRLGGKVTQPDVSRWLKGAEPTKKNWDRILTLARELGLVPDIRSEDVAATIAGSTPRTVPLKGYVGANSELVYFRGVADDDLDQVAAPEGASDSVVGAEIWGKSLGKFFDRWLVFYEDVRSPVTPDLIGEICVVGLEDGRAVVKKIETNGQGGYRLVANTDEPPIENARIEWAAKVIHMRPK